MCANYAGSAGASGSGAHRAARDVRRSWNCTRGVAGMRQGSIKRVSKETQIQISLAIEGHGRYQVSTGIRFFDHMLELFAHDGGFDLKLKARCDLDVDQHHT